MKYYENSVVQENSGGTLSEGPGMILPNAEDHSSLAAEASGLCDKMRKAAESSSVCSIIKNKQTIAKSESKMEIGQMEPVASTLLKFPIHAAVRAKEPVICSLKIVTSRAALDDQDQKKTEVLKQANTNIFPSFCVGKLDTKDLTKLSKAGKPCKKPKTTTFFQSTANTESLRSRTLFTYANKTDLQSKVPDLFFNPFSQNECKAQGNEGKSCKLSICVFLIQGNL